MIWTLTERRDVQGVCVCEKEEKKSRRNYRGDASQTEVDVCHFGVNWMDEVCKAERNFHPWRSML